MQPGMLDKRVALEEPVEAPNGQGGIIESFIERDRSFAHYRYLVGGEVAQAARLAGRQPIVITVRATTASRAVGTDWRVRDLDSDAVFGVRSVVPSEDNAFLAITCESGVVP